MAKECTCEPEHSVGKLGHSADCPWWGAHLPTDQPRFSPHDPCVNSNVVHDFSWATYEDDRMSTGVCRCGLREIDYDMARML